VEISLTPPRKLGIKESEAINKEYTMSVFVQTSSKSKTKKETIYAFGREDRLEGQPIELVGYKVYKWCINSNNNVRGGLAKTWRYVERDLSHSEAIALMNRKLKYVKY